MTANCTVVSIDSLIVSVVTERIIVKMQSSSRRERDMSDKTESRKSESVELDDGIGSDDTSSFAKRRRCNYHAIDHEHFSDDDSDDDIGSDDEHDGKVAATSIVDNIVIAAFKTRYNITAIDGGVDAVSNDEAVEDEDEDEDELIASVADYHIMEGMQAFDSLHDRNESESQSSTTSIVNRCQNCKRETSVIAGEGIFEAAMQQDQSGLPYRLIMEDIVVANICKSKRMLVSDAQRGSFSMLEIQKIKQLLLLFVREQFIQ